MGMIAYHKKSWDQISFLDGVWKSSSEQAKVLQKFFKLPKVLQIRKSDLSRGGGLPTRSDTTIAAGEPPSHIWLPKKQLW